MISLKIWLNNLPAETDTLLKKIFLPSSPKQKCNYLLIEYIIFNFDDSHILYSRETTYTHGKKIFLYLKSK